LTVRTQGSIPVRTFFPGNPQPLEVLDDPIHGGIGRSLYIRIFNAENKGSLIPFCKEKIEEGRPSVSDMEKPGRGRSKTNPNR
jgi:hypothetical protein